MDLDLGISSVGLGISSLAAAAPLSPFAIPGDDLSGTSVYPDEAQAHAPRLRKDRASKIDTILAALDDLRKSRISVMDLLLAILGGEFSELYFHRLAFLLSLSHDFAKQENTT
jgi:hypothetical protein